MHLATAFPTLARIRGGDTIAIRVNTAKKNPDVFISPTRDATMNQRLPRTPVTKM
jgi:hypothetical protein